MTPQAVAIYGLGLIGGSLGLALRGRTDPPRVLGYDADPEAARLALERGAVDELLRDPRSLPGEVDFVATAVPPRIAMELVPSLGDLLPPAAVLTDLSSVMLPVLGVVRSKPGLRDQFVASHPLRGSEQGGIGAARTDLYAGASVIIGAPLDAASPAARVGAVWASIRARPLPMAPALHDALVALTSHLPQVASTALVRTLRRTGSLTGMLAQSAGPGLRDTARLAASPPDLWFDILTLNAEKLVPALELLEREIRGLRHAVETNDPALRTLLEEARAFHRELFP